MYKNKIKLQSELPEFFKKIKGKKIVFTNGCFDILHVGHVRYLQKAKLLGDLLFIGLNTDASVKKLKGPSRPVVCESDRAEIIAALEFVDCVVLFNEDTPYELISKIKPDILVKGGDYKEENIVGRDIVLAKGGKVVVIPFEDNKSTTNIIEKIVKGKC